MSFFTGFGVSALIYYTLNRIFPVPGGIGSPERSDRFEEVDLSGYDYVPGEGYTGHSGAREDDGSAQAERGSIAKSEGGSDKKVDEDVDVKVEPVKK